MKTRIGLFTVVISVMCGALASGAPASGVLAAGSSTPLPGAIGAACPKPASEALAGDAIARATDAALSQAHLIYRSLDLSGMRATEAVLAPFNSERGGYARKCGSTVRNRTVVVDLEFPAMKPSSSLSQSVVLLSRFAGSFRVWAVLQ